MKYVIDYSIAENWYLPNRVTVKALDLRRAFFNQTHELLAPDLFLAECAEMLLRLKSRGYSRKVKRKMNSAICN